MQQIRNTADKIIIEDKISGDKTVEVSVTDIHALHHLLTPAAFRRPEVITARPANTIVDEINTSQIEAEQARQAFFMPA